MQENGEATTVDIEAAREALEKFVMENDELLELEARIGRFNIFDALGIVNAEIKHSNFLGWLLDPAESHGAGDLFLKAVLMDMLRQTHADLRPKGVNLVDLDGATISDVRIEREWRNIDLLVVCESPRLVLAIENKIRSGEHSGQLARYNRIVRDEFKSYPGMFVFLTRDGDDSSDDDWTNYSYRRIKEVLERVRRTNAGAIGEDIDTFLDHYLHLIGSRFMNDPEIERLCKQIYKTHRHAIELIFERVKLSGSAAVRHWEIALQDSEDDWELFPSSDSRIRFGTRGWLDAFPAIGTRKTFDQRLWIVPSVAEERKGLVFRVNVWPCSDSSIRQTVINRLVADPREFGFKLFFKRAAEQNRTGLCAEVVIPATRVQESDDEQLAAAVRKKLAEIQARLTAAMKAIRDLNLRQ